MDTFGITILVIVISTLLTAYIRRVTKDKCLKGFEGYYVTLQSILDERYEGKLEVESTGIELIYRENLNVDKIPQTSYILYKGEYASMQALVLEHDKLSPRNKKRREKELQKTYHPNMPRRLKRRILNVFKLLKDSLMEIVNAISGKVQSTTEGNNLLVSNEKYTKKVNQEMINTIDASYDPLLEKYIGNKVVVWLKEKDVFNPYDGVLKDYTQEYITLLDVKYLNDKKCDCVFNRKYCVVRSLSEDIAKHSIFSEDFDIRRYKKFFKKANVDTYDE